MKRILLIITILFCAISCSWIDAKTKEDIEKKTAEAISKIEKAADEQVKGAQTRIENEIAISVRKASDNIDTLVAASISQIEQATDQKVQQAIDNEISRLEDKLNNLSWAALISIAFGLIGVAFGLASWLKQRESKFKNEVIRHVTDSKRIKDYISGMVSDNEHQSKTVGVTHEDVRNIVRKFLSDPKIHEYLAKQINTSAVTGAASVVPKQTPEQTSLNVEPMVVQRFELYARDSNTKVLSDTFTSHQKGKTIYKLIMDSSDSTTAILDLCLDKDDAVGRILRFNNEDIDSICTVTRNSDKPEAVRVLKKGKAERTENSEWIVTEKIEIELS